MRHIFVCEPFIGKEELHNVTKCLRTTLISSRGKYIPAFETAFAKFCGVKYAISATSGTSALHLALVSLGIGNGDEVIIPTFTMAATAFAVIYTGAEPVLVDAEPDTFNLDPSKIAEKITARTKAILVVHL